MDILVLLIAGWTAIAVVLLVGWHLFNTTQSNRARTRLDELAAIDLISSRAYREASNALARAVESSQEENRAMLREVIELVHGPAQPPDEDRDDTPPETEMYDPFAGLLHRDPTDDSLPDAEIRGYGTGRAVMESDVVIE